MARDRREPIGDGPGFSEARTSAQSRGKSAPGGARKRKPPSPRPAARDDQCAPTERATARSSAGARAPLHANFSAPELDAPETTNGNQPVAALSRDVWVTKDGRELTIKEMYRPHLGNAQAVLSKWLKAEKDPVKRRELKSWRSKMRRELVKREKAWQAKRKKQSREQS